MDYFDYRDGSLFAEDIDIESIVATHGTPCYIYSRATLERHWQVFDRALGEHPHLICYAVKANSNLAVLDVLARLGSGFDIVSGGELERVLAAGGNPAKVVFSGVGKQADELRVGLSAGIRCFNIESRAELELLDRIAGDMRLCAPISVRVNPDVDAGTHPYIATGLKDNKFGIDSAAAMDVYRLAAELEHIEIVGIDCHIGSQLTVLEPFIDAVTRILALIDRLAEAGIEIRHLDVGGGLGVRYRQEQPPLPDAYAAALLHLLRDRSLEVWLEPGRAIAANAGVLVTRIEYIKAGATRRFAIVDAAMNDLLRPALYNAWQEIVPVRQRDLTTHTYDVVGPICETGDFLGKMRELAIEPGDLLAVRSAGAYGFSMASNYNTRPRPPEIMVDGGHAWLVRRRETVDRLLEPEQCLPGRPVG